MTSAPINLDLTYSESMRLITAFKKHSILWNPHIRGFHNRENKEEAWKIVAAESGIETEVCKRKMKSLMASCRREKIKIIQSRRSGNPKDVVEPKWRYWNAFKFLRGIDDDDEDPLGTAPEMDILDPTMNPSCIKAKLKSNKRLAKSTPAPATETNCDKEPKKSNEKHSIGNTVVAKLRKMYPDQRLFADNLINQALYKGMLCQLNPQSQIRTPGFQVQSKSPVQILFQQEPSMYDAPNTSTSNDFHLKQDFIDKSMEQDVFKSCPSNPLLDDAEELKHITML